MSANNLQETMQSAYRKCHSTETALIRVQHDLIQDLSQQRACLLVLLDLSAVFDTVDHQELLRVLRSMGVDGLALRWFRSYLEGREQVITIKSHASNPYPITSGVPQGSVLGPILFTAYTASLGTLLTQHSMKYSFYADDSSVYVSFEPSDLQGAITDVERCIAAVKNWMATKSLKMNDSKTDVILLSTPRIRRDIPGVVTVMMGDTQVEARDAVRTLYRHPARPTPEHGTTNLCFVSQLPSSPLQHYAHPQIPHQSSL